MNENLENMPGESRQDQLDRCQWVVDNIGKLEGRVAAIKPLLELLDNFLTLTEGEFLVHLQELERVTRDS